MDSIRAAKIAKFSAELHHFCRIWPQSKFYFGQLLSYINTTNRETSLSLRVFQLLEDNIQDLPLVRETMLPAISAEALDSTNSLFIVEGHLCPDAVVELASRCILRPEFFLGHLELERVSNLSRTSYELPALPSRRRNMVHIRLVTLWRSPHAGDPINIQPEDRVKADNACREYEKQLVNPHKAGSHQAGRTRFRKVHLHNSQHFTVEQMVSLCAIPSTSNGRMKYDFVYLLDSGQSLDASESYPWNGILGPKGFCPSLMHAVHYNEQRTTAPSINQQTNAPNASFTMHPYHPLHDFGADHRRDLMRSPFFSLSSILTASARSWNQVLNFIEDDVAAHEDAPNEQASAALTQMRFNAGVIQRFQSFIQQDFETVRDGVWSNISSMEEVEHTSQQRDDLDTEHEITFPELSRDYEALLGRCKALSKRCETASSLLQSAIALLESQKSIQQTVEVNKLTKLAFVFVPLSLVSSVFGMNVSEIDPGTTPRVWQFILVCILVLIPCLYLSLGLRVTPVVKWSQKVRAKLTSSGEARMNDSFEL